MTTPLCIDSVRVPGGGRIGMTACPGRWRLFGFIGAEEDGIENDLLTIRRWGARSLVSLVEPEELNLLGIDDFGPTVAGQGLHWYHLPIPDFRAPGSDFEMRWASIGPELHRRLREGEDIAVHCLAGLGRTGTVVARLLVECGLTPEDSIGVVRASRPGAVQNREQERYVLERRWNVPPSPASAANAY